MGYTTKSGYEVLLNICSVVGLNQGTLSVVRDVWKALVPFRIKPSGGDVCGIGYLRSINPSVEVFLPLFLMLCVFFSSRDRVNFPYLFGLSLC